MTVLMVIGVVVPGINAMLTPSTRNANASTKPLLTNSLYSSEANTKSKNRSPPSDSNWNSNEVASNEVTPDAASKSGSPPFPFTVVVLGPEFGPLISPALPLVRTIPDSIPIELLPLVNVPAAFAPPLNTGDPTRVIPGPRSVLVNTLASLVTTPD